MSYLKGDVKVHFHDWNDELNDINSIKIKKIKYISRM